MKIYKTGNDSFNGTVTNYIETKLDTINFTGNPLIRDVAKGAQINAYNGHKALARLCDVLADKDILSARDIMYIAEDFYGGNISFEASYGKEE